jgi:hypothetical protein
MGGVSSTYGRRGESYTGLWWGNLRKRDNLKDPGVDGKIIFRWTVSMWLRIGTGNETSGSIKMGEFLV